MPSRVVPLADLSELPALWEAGLVVDKDGRKWTERRLWLLYTSGYTEEDCRNCILAGGGPHILVEE